MTLSLGAASAMTYDVWVLAAGALMLQTCDQGMVSIDHLLNKRHKFHAAPASSGQFSPQ
jgi:hypothetical protein